MLKRHLLIILVCSLCCGTALANTAQDYFDDGNRLFKDDLYWAALLRYREARDAGLDTTTLAYNMGVAHYKASQHVRARQEFELALASPRLRPLAHYNLGLNAFQLAQYDEALRWFRLARDQRANTELSELSVEAIRRIRELQKLEDPVEQRAERRREDVARKSTKLDVFLSAGFGNSDNIYRTPSIPYTDFAQAGNPAVTPTPVSGAFVPVDLSLRYNLKNQLFENFYTRYQLSAKVFQDKELDNANEFVHELSFGSRYNRERNGVTRRVFSAFKIAQHDETYFDPDDGLTREIDGVDIGDRLSHRRYGPEIHFRQEGPKLGIGAFFEGQLRNYDQVDAVPEYDHEFLRFGAHVQYKFTRTSLLRIKLEGVSRTFGDRPSYDLDGVQRLGNPDVEYQYVTAAVVARQKLTRYSWFSVEGQRTQRTDGYVGYYDYTRDAVEAKAEWHPTARIRLAAAARYSLYDFPNAFAFHDQALSRRTLETLHGSLQAAWKMTKRFSLVLDAEMRETASNDTRIQYDQTQFMLGVQWAY